MVPEVLKLDDLLVVEPVLDLLHARLGGHLLLLLLPVLKPCSLTSEVFFLKREWLKIFVGQSKQARSVNDEGMDLDDIMEAARFGCCSTTPPPTPAAIVVMATSLGDRKKPGRLRFLFMFHG